MSEECCEESKKLVHTLALKTLKKADEILTKGTLKKTIKLKDGNKESLEQIEEELNTKDLKDIIELGDRASLTLGVNARFREKITKKEEVKILTPFLDFGETNE